MAAERSHSPRRGEASGDRDTAGRDAQRIGQLPDGDGRALDSNHATEHGADSSHGGRAHDAFPSVVRFDAFLTVLERRGLLARATSVHCGDLDVKLAPLVVVPTPPERDVLKEGDDAKKEFDEIQYGSA